MRLCHARTSSSVRKVMVMLIDIGLNGKIETIPTNSWDPDTDLPNDNTIGKNPGLKLDGLHDGPKIFPSTGRSRWAVLKLHALADGILNAAAICVVEGKRPMALQFKDWVARQQKAIQRSLDALEKAMPELDGRQLTIAHIAASCALGYLNFRKLVDDWRRGRPSLAK